MTLANRVSPRGEFLADPARGLLMGVRGGMFHDPVARRLTARRWASRRWICCSLDFEGRNRHPVWSRGYTQLFFLDEPTALAAGHRPCAECRRPAAQAFRAALEIAGRPPGNLEALDRILHAERLDGRRQRTHVAEASSLPDGAACLIDGHPAMLRGPVALAWTPRGYEAPRPRPDGRVETLTPPIAIAALVHGYRPVWHPSAPA